MGNRTEQTYAAIDVGTTKVATLVAKVSPAGTMEVVALGHAPSAGLSKGIVVGTEELSASIRKSVDEAQAMLGRSLPAVHVGITGSHLTCINAAADLDPDVTQSGKPFTQEDVDRLLSTTASQTDGRRRVVHVVPRSYRVDSRRDLRSPLGLTGERLGAESHIVVGDTATMARLEKIVRSTGVKVKGMVIEHLASAEAVLTAEERETGVILVDIGGGTSDIAVYKHGALWYTGAIPVAGHHFTNDVAVGLGLPPAVAESLKIEHGSTALDSPDPQQVIEVSSGLGDHVRPISQATLNKLLRDRAVELVRMMLHKVGESGLPRVPDGGIVLTGGSANLAGLADIAADYGRCSVRVGKPAATLGLPAELEDSAFSTGVGLLLWAIQRQHPGAVAESITMDQTVMEKLRGWFSKFTPRKATGVRV